MAKRTPEQNIARREREAEAKRKKRAAEKAKAQPKGKPAAKKAAPVKAKAKRKSPAAPVAAPVPVISAEKMKAVFTGKAKRANIPAIKKMFAEGTPIPTPPDEKPMHLDDVDQPVFADLPPGYHAPVKLKVETMQIGEPTVHTMARSYVRKSGAGQGKLRAGTYQCTVAFTEDQMKQVRAYSIHRGISLAEAIRSCTVAHLSRGFTHP